jgi:hypothetical protein
VSITGEKGDTVKLERHIRKMSDTGRSKNLTSMEREKSDGEKGNQRRVVQQKQ